MFLNSIQSNFFKILCVTAILFFVFNLSAAFAVSGGSSAGTTTGTSDETGVRSGLNEAANVAGIPTGSSETSLPARIGTIISYILSFVGIVFLILMIAGGLMWMTAAGNEQTVDKAKSLITNAVIGMIIVFAAYAITYFVTNTLLAT